MNEKDHNPNERLDRMLRQWGVDEASRQVNIPPMPDMSRQQQWWMPLLRWGPPVAAAAMLLLAIVLFSITPPRYVKSAGSDSSVQKTPEEISAELVETKASLKDARAALAEARSKFDQEIGQLNTEIITLKIDVEKERVDFLTRTNNRIATLNQIIGETDAQLTRLTGELKEVKKDRAAINEQLAELTKERGRNNPKLAAAVSELDRVGKKYRQLLADSDKARTDLATMNARHRSALDDFRHAYLSAAAAAGGRRYVGRRIDLSVRQSACRGGKLLERCAEIRPSVQAASTGKLVDRLEVVLTRLSLLNVADPAEAKAFAALVRRGGLVEKIDETLAKGQRVDIRTWLLEAKLILEGAENA